jgi:hypothetical protein
MYNSSWQKRTIWAKNRIHNQGGNPGDILVRIECTTEDSQKKDYLNQSGGDTLDNSIQHGICKFHRTYGCLSQDVRLFVTHHLEVVWFDCVKSEQWLYGQFNWSRRSGLCNRRGQCWPGKLSVIYIDGFKYMAIWKPLGSCGFSDRDYLFSLGFLQPILPPPRFRNWVGKARGHAQLECDVQLKLAKRDYLSKEQDSQPRWQPRGHTR